MNKHKVKIFTPHEKAMTTLKPAAERLFYNQTSITDILFKYGSSYKNGNFTFGAILWGSQTPCTDLMLVLLEAQSTFMQS
jgi:hypothetical protein